MMFQTVPHWQDYIPLNHDQKMNIFTQNPKLTNLAQSCGSRLFHCLRCWHVQNHGDKRQNNGNLNPFESSIRKKVLSQIENCLMLRKKRTKHEMSKQRDVQSQDDMFSKNEINWPANKAIYGIKDVAPEDPNAEEQWNLKCRRKMVSSQHAVVKLGDMLT